MVSRPQGHEPDGKRSESSAPNGSREALEHIPELLEELREYGTHYIAARAGATQAKARELTALAVMGMLGLLALIAVIAVSVVLALNGVALGLGQLFGGRVWLGQLVTGVAVLVLVALAAWIGIRRWKRTSRDQTVAEYEQRKEQQRARFNHSVEERAATAGVERPES